MKLKPTAAPPAARGDNPTAAVLRQLIHVAEQVAWTYEREQRDMAPMTVSHELGQAARAAIKAGALVTPAAKHTPTPPRPVRDDTLRYYVAHDAAGQNRVFERGIGALGPIELVHLLRNSQRAVNAHEALTKLVRRAATEIQEMGCTCGEGERTSEKNATTGYHEPDCVGWTTAEEYRAALALAEGGKS